MLGGEKLWLNFKKTTTTYKSIITIMCLWLADALIEDFLLVPFQLFTKFKFPYTKYYLQIFISKHCIIN